MSAIGQTQIINGKSYQMYTPEWYSAMDAENARQAQLKGTNAGTTAGAALDALKGATGIGTTPSGVPATTPTTPVTPASAIPSVSFPGGSGSVPSTTSAPSAAPFGFPAGTGAPSAPSVTPNPSQVQLQDVNSSGAETAAFNRAKDLVGQTSQSALTGLRSTLASRGMLGSGSEYGGTSRIIQTGQQELGDTARQQAIDEAQRASDAAALRYTGGISQRGQDITSRGQDLSASNAYQQILAELSLGQYQGQIAQRGQDVTMRGQDIAGNTSAGQLALAQQQQQQQLILDALRSIAY